MSKGAIWLHRQLLECPELKEPLALALWVHLLLRASHKPARVNFRKTVFTIERGQLITSLRQLEAETGIPMRPLRRLLGLFEKSNMVKTDTVGGTAATLVTICKYEDFQSIAAQTDTANGTEATQKRHTEQEEKILTPTVESHLPTSESPEAPRPRYRWSGRVVRLNDGHYESWRKSYHGLTDLDAHLQSLDDYLAGDRASDADRKNWFSLVSGALRKRHLAALAEREKRPQAKARASDADRLRSARAQCAAEGFRWETEEGMARVNEILRGLKARAA